MSPCRNARDDSDSYTRLATNQWMKCGLASLDSNRYAVLSKGVVGNGFEGFGKGVNSLAFVKGRYIADCECVDGAREYHKVAAGSGSAMRFT